MKLWCNKMKLSPAGIEPRPHLSQASTLTTIETLINIFVFDRKRSLLHHKSGTMPWPQNAFITVKLDSVL